MSIFYTPTPDFYNDYIAHHGILGMKWGKRNGPPYPLGSDKSTGKKLKDTESVKKKKISATGGAVSARAKLAYQQSSNNAKKATGSKYATPSSRITPNPSKDFNSTEKVRLNDKELKKWYKGDGERPHQYLHKYEDEFDNTDKGKKLRLAFEKEWEDAMGFGDEDYDWKKFSKAQDSYLKARQEYAVNKFLKNDSNKFTLQQIAYDQYPLYYRPDKVSEQDVKKYLLEEQWKLHRV